MNFWWLLHVCLPLLFAGVVFGLGRLFPVQQSMKQKPSYQPPGWVFGVAWFYITFTLGALCSWSLQRSQNGSVLLLPLTLLLLWCAWIVNESFKQNSAWGGFNAISTGLLIGSGVLLTVYMVETYTVLGSFTYFLIPAVVWLFVATSLNGYLNNENGLATKQKMERI